MSKYLLWRLPAEQRLHELLATAGAVLDAARAPDLSGLYVALLRLRPQLGVPVDDGSVLAMDTAAQAAETVLGAARDAARGRREALVPRSCFTSPRQSAFTLVVVDDGRDLDAMVRWLVAVRLVGVRVERLRVCACDRPFVTAHSRQTHCTDACARRMRMRAYRARRRATADPQEARA